MNVTDTLDDAEFDPDDAWPWFLEDALDAELATDRPYEELRAEFEDTPFILRARALLEFVGEGREGTDEGVLTDADTVEILQQLGIEREATTMWDAPELIGPWLTLFDGDWVDVEGTRIVPGEGIAPAAHPDEDPETYALFVHALLSRLIGSMIERELDEGGFVGVPDSLAALMVATRPEGLTMPHPEAVMKMDKDPDELGQYIDTLQDLSRLGLYGVLHSGEDERLHFRAPGIITDAIDAAVTAISQTLEDDDD